MEKISEVAKRYQEHLGQQIQDALCFRALIGLKSLEKVLRHEEFLPPLRQVSASEVLI